MKPQIFQFNKQNISVIRLANNEIIFRAKDVADVLEYTRTETAIKLLDDDEKLLHLTGESGQGRRSWMLTESGLYHLILKSTKPEAKAFRKWVTGTVLPAIRIANSYGTDELSQQTAELQEIKNLMNTKKEAIKDLQIEASDLISQISEKTKEYKQLETNFWSVFQSDPRQQKINL